MYIAHLLAPGPPAQCMAQAALLPQRQMGCRSCAACLRGLTMMLCLKSLLLGWRWLQQLALHLMRLQSWLLQLRRVPPPQHWLQTWQCLCWAQ